RCTSSHLSFSLPICIRLGRHLWKSFHFSIYFAAAGLFWHGLFTDPGLKYAPVDWFDGGKLFVESCLLFIAAISLLRLRHARKKAIRLRQVSRQTIVSTELLQWRGFSPLLCISIFEF